MLPLHALHFRLWVKVMNPCLILDYNSVDKITGSIFILRQQIPRNIEPRSFLVISQHSRFLSCRDLGHTQDICKNCLHCPKTYAHFAGYTLQVSPPVTHNQIVNDLHIFISGSIFGAARPCIILNALSSSLKFCSPFFHCAIRRRLIPKCFHGVFVNFLGSHYLLTNILSPLSLQLSPFCKFDALSSLNTVVQKQSSVTKCFLLPR